MENAGLQLAHLIACSFLNLIKA